MPQEQREKIKNIFKVYRNLLPSDTENNLVHADFDPANILVTEVNGQIEVSGILDFDIIVNIKKNIGDQKIDLLICNYNNKNAFVGLIAE